MNGVCVSRAITTEVTTTAEEFKNENLINLKINGWKRRCTDSSLGKDWIELTRRKYGTS